MEQYIRIVCTLKNGRIDKYQFEDGYCQAVRTSENVGMDVFSFYYYDFDHLGNVRQVTEVDSPKGRVVQTNNYYPFGMLFCDGTKNYLDQKHKYNGKEFDNMYGLNTYDYGARQYNPVTLRWDRVDPMAEKYRETSPYVYCANDPIKHVDPDGNIKREFMDKYTNNDEKNKIATMIATADASYFNDDKQAINLWAHGSPDGFDYKGLFTVEGKDGINKFYNIIQNDKELKETFESTDSPIIVLHMCSTAKFAQMLSQDKRFENATIIAPNGKLEVKACGQSKNDGVRDFKNSKFSYTIKSPHKNVHGVWKAYKNGKNVANYVDFSKPGSNGFNYEKNKPQNMINGKQ
jgi:RHS repeat-associated protein